MSGLDHAELYFVLDRNGALVAYQETHGAWSGVVTFSSRELARQFVTQRQLEGCEVAAVELSDAASIAALINQVKPRAVRCLILDLDYHSGRYLQIEFEGERLGEATQRQFTPHPH